MFLTIAVAVFVIIGIAAWSSNAAQAAEARKKQEALKAAIPLVRPLTGGAELQSSAALLLRQFDGLTSFTEVARWDAAAEALCNQLDDFAGRASLLTREAERVIAEYTPLPDASPYVKTATIEKTRRLVVDAQTEAQRLRSMADELAERIDMTPNDRAAQRELLRELRADKKELQLRKREIRQAAAQVRREARAASAGAGMRGFIIPTYDRKLAAVQRRRIRREAEAQLRPHESELDAIERQLLALDRRIAWLSRFVDDAE